MFQYYYSEKTLQKSYSGKLMKSVCVSAALAATSEAYFNALSTMGEQAMRSMSSHLLGKLLFPLIISFPFTLLNYSRTHFCQTQRFSIHSSFSFFWWICTFHLRDKVVKKAVKSLLRVINWVEASALHTLILYFALGNSPRSSSDLSYTHERLCGYL